MSEGKRGKQDGDITGVSRSGRVRKKSSKLMDFESPDDIDTRFKQRIPSGSTPQSSIQRGRKSNASTDRTPESMFKSPGSDTDDMDREVGSDSGNSDSEGGGFPAQDSALDDSSLESDDDEDFEVSVPAQIGAPRQTPPGSSGAAATAEGGTGGTQSLYMLEKSSKKRLVIRDGKIVGRVKAQRKDKGQTRFTAYMLWAKEVRGELLRANPELDFATMSKRLGELWATVPNNEKYNWKRRAKRMAVKGHRLPDAAAAFQAELAKPKPAASRSKFINMNKKGAQGGGKAGRVLQLGTPSVVGGNVPLSPPSPRGGGKGGVGGGVADAVLGAGPYKVIGSQPVDVAAHLKLLGESLAIIGERLQEHEGQIAVSGSLSVLLDSLLCALGPLVCLSQQVPETDGCSPELLARILDNIAYFMPGL